MSIKRPSILTGSVHGFRGAGLIALSKKTPIGVRETSEYSNRSFPWMVKFHILENPISMEYIQRVYFLRAPEPYVAAFTACALWREWEKYNAGKGDQQWPEVAGPSVAECIDEQDYMSAWKDAQKWPRLAKGDTRNPAAFTFFTDEEFVRVWFPEGYFTPPPKDPIPM